MKNLHDWTRNDCLDWLENEGVINCAMASELLEDELQVEVALQAEAIGQEIPGMHDLLCEYWGKERYEAMK